MKLSWRVELPQLLLIAAMFGVAACSWPRVSDRLPVHWNLHGQVDRWGGKFEGLLLMPIIVSGLYLLILILPLIDPRRDNYRNFLKAFNAIRVAFVLFMAVIYGVLVASAFGYHVDITTVVLWSMGALFIVIGNFMSKIRPNWFVGVRTPWTLSSRLSWDKTHWLAGWLFVLMGVLFGVVAVARTGWVTLSMIVVDVLCIIWIIVYSYLVYRGDPHRVHPSGSSPGTE